jgi:hypothetical protein
MLRRPVQGYPGDDAEFIRRQFAATRTAGAERDVHEREDTHVARTAAVTEGA